jgi:hypothetical protein
VAERGAEDPYMWVMQEGIADDSSAEEKGGRGGSSRGGSRGGSSRGSGTSTTSLHAILHRNGCKGGAGCEPSVSGQHAFSADGYTWHLSKANAYTATVEYTNGSTVDLLKRERPHLILDPASGVPTHLVTGAGERDPSAVSAVSAVSVVAGEWAPSAVSAVSVAAGEWAPSAISAVSVVAGEWAPSKCSQCSQCSSRRVGSKCSQCSQCSQCSSR